MLINFLFPRYANRYGVSLFLLAMRVFIGMLFMMHGLDKAVNFNILVGNFPDPLGIGPFKTTLNICNFLRNFFHLWTFVSHHYDTYDYSDGGSILRNSSVRYDAR